MTEKDSDISVFLASVRHCNQKMIAALS